MPLFFDGAHVMLQRTDTMETIELSPTQLDADVGMPQCGGMPIANTPWCNDGTLPPLVFGGQSDAPTTARRIAIPPGMGDVPLQLVFEVGFDEDNCDPVAGGMGGGNPDPWQLYRVIVALAPP
jgi:hypothetical protein